MKQTVGPQNRDLLSTTRNAVEMERTGNIPAPLADSTLKVIDFLSKSQDERLQEAARIVKEAISPNSSAADAVPDELKPYSDRLKAKENELNERDAQAARDRQQSAQIMARDSGSPEATTVSYISTADNKRRFPVGTTRRSSPRFQQARVPVRCP